MHQNTPYWVLVYINYLFFFFCQRLHLPFCFQWLYFVVARSLNSEWLESEVKCHWLAQAIYKKTTNEHFAVKNHQSSFPFWCYLSIPNMGAIIRFFSISNGIDVFVNSDYCSICLCVQLADFYDSINYIFQFAFVFFVASRLSAP